MLRDDKNLFSYRLEAVIWSLIGVYLVLVALHAWNPSPFALWLATIGFACAFIHCALTYCFKNALALFELLPVSWTPG